MSEEGELYEEIADSIYQSYWYYDDLKVIKEILKKTKQDFAELLHEEDPLYWLHHVGQLQLDFKEKFEKWFGEKK